MIGLDDFIWENKYGYTVEVISNKAEIICLNKKVNMRKTDPQQSFQPFPHPREY